MSEYYNIIWLSKTKEYKKESEEYTIYEVYMKKDKKKYIMKVEYKEGECYSGYTSAQRLELDLIETNNFWPIQYYPIWKFRIYENDIYDFESWKDYIEIKVYDDEYYPSAKFELKKDEWSKTPRYEKLWNFLYLFYGDNWTGKSTIAKKAFDPEKILETDSLNQIYDILEYNLNRYEVIVVGGKHKDKKELIRIIKEDLICSEDWYDRHLIEVNFESYN